MPYAIIFAPQAVEDLKGLKAKLPTEVRDGIETHLRHEPDKVSRSRIERLRKLSQPQYRLRIGDVRVFYDISDKNVEILAIVLESEAAIWLAKHGKSEQK